MEYLQNYNIDINKINNKLVLNNENWFIDNKDNIINVLDYFREIGLNNFNELINKRMDILFYTKEQLEEKINKYDKNFILFVINNNVSSLKMFDI